MTKRQKRRQRLREWIKQRRLEFKELGIGFELGEPNNPEDVKEYHEQWNEAPVSYSTGTNKRETEEDRKKFGHELSKEIF
jgi:hypothetical protein